MLRPARPFLASSVFLIASIGPWAAWTQTPRAPHPDKKLLDVAAAVVVDGHICDAAELKVPGGPSTVIAIIDYSGRRFCNTVLRIRHGRPPVVMQELGAMNPDDLTEILKDLDGDGYPELLLSEALTPYRGARCQAAVPRVYKCSSRTCADHTRRFSRFLRQWLGETEAELGEQTKSGNVACLTISRDKERRILGIEPHAGFELAQQWLRGRDQDRREDAALVLSDIGDKEARTILSGLVGDENDIVARLAQLASKARQ